MRLLVLALLPLLGSCALLQTPARTLKAVGRTFGLAQNEAAGTDQEPGTVGIAVKASE